MSQWSALNMIGPVAKTAIILRADYRCAWCGSFCYPHDRHVDHVRPRAEGGRTHARNLVLSCSGCNVGRRPDELPRKALRRGRTWDDVLASIKAQTSVKISPGSPMHARALDVARAWYPEQFERRRAARARYLERQAEAFDFGAAA